MSDKEGAFVYELSLFERPLLRSFAYFVSALITSLSLYRELLSMLSHTYALGISLAS
nr:MAG TPA: hypothetical protein [Caudoviricetes sp.]